jgi:hypothetical protein
MYGPPYAVPESAEGFPAHTSTHFFLSGAPQEPPGRSGESVEGSLATGRAVFDAGM